MHQTEENIRSRQFSPPTIEGQEHLFRATRVPPLAHGGLHIAGRRDSNQNSITIDLLVKNHSKMSSIPTGLAVSASVTGAAYVRNLVN